MIRVNRTYTRKSVAVPWHTEQPYVNYIYDEEFKENVRTKYGNTLHYLSNIESDDGLTLNFESLWESMEDFQQYLNDPICCKAWERRDEHNNLYLINSEPSVITTVTHGTI
jgi:heme-degrading monooxygenase HmoA